MQSDSGTDAMAKQYVPRPLARIASVIVVALLVVSPSMVP